MANIQTNQHISSESAELADFRKGVIDWIKHNTPADPGFFTATNLYGSWLRASFRVSPRMATQGLVIRVFGHGMA